MNVVELLLETAYQDTQQLFKNNSLGDKFSIPRDVDFLLVSDSEEQASTVCKFINENQYGSAVTQQVESNFRICVTITMPIEQNIICSVSGLMACISKLFGVEYDGWGCVIQQQT